MSAANQVDQNEKLLCPDLSHRLTLCKDDKAQATADHLNRAIEQMASRAQGVLTLLQSEFSKADPDDDCRLNDEVIYHSLETVSREIEDMKRSVEAFWRAIHHANNAASHKSPEMSVVHGRANKTSKNT